MLGPPSGGLELLIPEAVSLGRASEDEYSPTLDDGNIGRVKALPGVIVTQAAGDRRTRAASCDPEVVEIRTVRGRLFPCVSAA